MSPPIPRITPEEVKERLDQGDPILFIDTRNPTAWAQSEAIIPGAIRMLASEVGNHVAELPKGRTVVAYCT
jgi:rhodanese-related sulfurtransferase